MIQFFHDVDFLIDILLKKGFCLYMYFADDFDCVESVVGFWGWGWRFILIITLFDFFNNF